MLCLDAQFNGQHQLQHNHQDLALPKPGGKKGSRRFNQHLAMQAAIWNTYVAAVKVESDNRALWDRYQVPSATSEADGMQVNKTALSPHNYYALAVEIEVPDIWGDYQKFRRHMIDNHLLAASPLSGTGPGSMEARMILDDLWKHLYGASGASLGQINVQTVYGDGVNESSFRQQSAKRVKKSSGAPNAAGDAYAQGMLDYSAVMASKNTAQETEEDLAWLQKLDAFCCMGGNLSTLVGQALQVTIKHMRKTHRTFPIPWTYTPLAFQKLPETLLGKINAERFFNLNGRPESSYREKFYGTYTDDEERERFREIEKKKKQEALTKQAQSMLAVTEKMRQQAMRAQIQQNMRAQQAKAAAAFAMQRNKVVSNTTQSSSISSSQAPSQLETYDDGMDTTT